MAAVMVVDDEENVTYIVGKILRNEGFAVHAVASGEDCLESIEEISPDILLIDVMMPDMNGWELVRELKDRGLADKIKIAMLTVVEKPDEKNADLGTYVLDYIKKPFDGFDIIRRVKRLDSL